MIKVSMPIIVEGRYDKITLENVVDTVIIPTNGFSVFKDREKLSVIKEMSERTGIIIMTDSDNAGMMIRNRIKNACKNGRVIDIYIPQITGKERRKNTPSKQGLLGVEGMSADILREAFSRFNIDYGEADARKEKITKSQFFSSGLSGRKESAVKRKSFARFLHLPDNLSANAFIDILNVLYTSEQFREQVSLWEQEADKR